MSLWVIRILWLSLCTLFGLAISQVQPELISRWFYGILIGFGFGGLLIAIDEMVKGIDIEAYKHMFGRDGFNYVGG